MTRLRILLVSPQFPPYHNGGYERSAALLAEQLTLRGHSVTVLTDRRRQHWKKCERKNNVLVKRLHVIFKKGFYSLSATMTLAAWLIANGYDYDVWHATQYGVHAGITALLGRFLGIPVTLKLTSTEGSGIKSVMTTSKLSPLLGPAHKLVTKAIPMTEDQRLEAIAFGYRKSQIELIPNGVDTDVFSPNKAKTTTTAPHLKKITCTARLTKVKNLEFLLKGWAAAIPYVSDGWKLQIIGDGPERKTLETLAKALGITARLTLDGQSSTVVEELRSSHIFVLTSLREGLSNALLEAMATGLPCITPPVSGATDAIRFPPAGIIIAQNSIPELTDAIVTLCNNPDICKQFSINARATAKQRYDIKTVCTKYENLFSAVSQD